MKSRNSKAIPLIISILLLFFSFETLFAQSVKEESIEEVSIDVMIKEIKEQFLVTFIYKDGLFYIPFQELFEIYKIKADVLLLQERIEGFYPTEGENYFIDIRNNTYTINDKKAVIASGSFLYYKEKIYATPEILNEIFSFKIVVDFGSLAMYNHNEKDIPLVQNKFLLERILIEEKKVKKKKAEQKKDSDISYPLQRSYFRFGTGGIDISESLNQEKTLSSYTIYSGFEALKGDFDAVISGNNEQNPKSIKDFPWRYRYSSIEDGYFNDVQLGYLISDTINQNSYYGAKITNMLFSRAETFTNKKISDYYLPGYTIELYINNTFISTTNTDEQGFYSFDIPVNYGTSFIELRFYGAYGERETKSFIYDVRDNFNKKNQFLYSASAGESQDGTQYIDIDTRYGIFDYLTLRAGEKIRIDSEDSNLTDEPYLSLAYWPLSNVVSNIETIKSRYNRGTVSFINKANGFSVNHTQYTDDKVLKKDTTMRANTSYLKYVPINASYSRKNYEYYYEDYYRTSLSYQTPFRLSNTLILNWSKWNDKENRYFDATLNMMYPLNNYILPEILNGASLNFLINYKDYKADYTKFSVKNSFSKSSSYTLDFAKNFYTDISNISLGAKKDLGKYYLTFACGADSSENYNVNLGIGTYWGYNDKTKEIMRYYENNHNRAGATIVSFHDKNNNHTLEEDEEVLKDAQLYINSSPKRDEDVVDSQGFFNSINVRAYINNILESKPYVTSVGLYAPVYKKTSFYARPNLYETIYNPYVQSANIYGLVYNEYNTTQTGVRVSLLDADSLKEKYIISDIDGEFYFEGIMPGTYVLSVNKDFADKNGVVVKSEPNIIKLLGGEEIDDVELHIVLPKKKKRI